MFEIFLKLLKQELNVCEIEKNLCTIESLMSWLLLANENTLYMPIFEVSLYEKRGRKIEVFMHDSLFIEINTEIRAYELCCFI